MEWYILILLSAVFIAISDLISKHSLFRMHAMEFLGMRGLFMLPILLIMVPFINFNQPLIVYALAGLTGLLLTGAILYRTKAVRHLDVSITSPLMNISPLFILILAAAFLDEVLTPLQIVAVFFIMLGAYVLQIQSRKDIFAPIRNMMQSKHIHYILFAIFTFSVAAVIDRFTLTTYGVDPLTYMFFAWLTASVVSIFLDIYNYGTKDLIYDLEHRKLPIAIICICIFFAFYFFLEGISQPEALIALAIPLKRMSSLIVTIVGGSFFHEKHVMRKAIGCVIMVVGAVIIVL